MSCTGVMRSGEGNIISTDNPSSDTRSFIEGVSECASLSPLDLQTFGCSRDLYRRGGLRGGRRRGKWSGTVSLTFGVQVDESEGPLFPTGPNFGLGIRLQIPTLTTPPWRPLEGGNDHTSEEWGGTGIDGEWSCITDVGGTLVLSFRFSYRL